ncbi:hypothetical protein [Halorhabdus amylolytica]|uniref:hypothetical protein n=1 Tax=Halorhabdus amylolytica TaxID=2559573 RepID=UPI0020BF9CCC|nr:hypothetical protein [Halorhabdus amylolytica]
MKDMADGEFCELGEGDVDVQGCADAAREADVLWFVYEHDDPEELMACLERGADVLESL